MLSDTRAIPFLLQHGILSPASLVDHTVSVRAIAPGGRVVTVTDEQGISFALKSAANSERAVALAREAGITRHLRTHASPGIRDALPRLIVFDQQAPVMVSETASEIRTLEDVHQQSRRFPVGISRTLGDLLGQLHTEWTPPNAAIGGPHDPPWVLSIHEPDMPLYRLMSHASREFVRVVQQLPALSRHLTRLRAGWTRTALIHGDLRWSNLLVAPAGPRSGMRQLTIVDWELARFGDPVWDVGTVFGEYLACWLQSIPLLGNDAGAQLPLARAPLERMVPALRAFWSAYARQAVSPGLLDATLTRAVEYAAAWLLQNAFERTQAADHMGGHALVHIQVSENILDDPAGAAASLLGIVRDSLVVA
jgi:thiamine kinase-like enzyme